VNPITAYALVERSWPWRLRGPGNAQSATNGLLFPGPTYRQNQVGGTTPITQTTPGPGIEIGYFSLHNRSGTTTFAGMAVRIPNGLWQAGQWTDASTTFTDDTADAQSAAGNDFPIETTTNNDGFVITCQVPFNAVSLDIGSANGGAGATRVMLRSNRAGTAWTTMAANELYVTLPAVTLVTGTTAANEGLIVWDVPEDWGTTTSAAIGTGVPLGQFAVNMRSTTAPTAAASALSLSIYRVYWVTEALADNGTFEFAPGAMGAYFAPEGDALVPMMASADGGNRVTVLVRPRG
jgi:hypothetical protein